MMKFVTESWEK